MSISPHAAHILPYGIPPRRAARSRLRTTAAALPLLCDFVLGLGCWWASAWRPAAILNNKRSHRLCGAGGFSSDHQFTPPPQQHHGMLALAVVKIKCPAPPSLPPSASLQSGASRPWMSALLALQPLICRRRAFLVPWLLPCCS